MAGKVSDKIVLDATTFIGPEYALLQRFSSSSFFTTHNVIRELRDFRSKANMEILKAGHKLQILDSDPKIIEQVKERIRKFDTKTKLSQTDIGLLALAHDLKGSLMTNDYRLQNLATLLSIPILARKESTIKKTKQWVLKCRSCGHIENEPLNNCPECGGDLRIVIKKSPW
ncbi:MAG: NOB1 family endonuclease [Candidatus Hodarchaeales archaeon]